MDGGAPRLRVPRSTGHFVLESGLHTDQWLELEALFCSPADAAAGVADLAAQIAARGCDAVCGPAIGGALLAQRVALELRVPLFFTVRTAGDPAGGLYRARYELPREQRPLVAGRRVALVDDAISSASATVASLHSLRASRATPVVAGCLIQLGSVGARRLLEHGLETISIVREDLDSWEPGDCPLCAAGVPLVRRD